MARLGFAISTLTTIFIAFWFLYVELNSRGISIPLAMMGMAVVVSGFGTMNATSDGISKDVRAAGWVAVLMVTLGFLYLLWQFNNWTVVGIVWVVMQVPMVIGLLTSPED